MYRAAIGSIVSELLRQNRLIVVSELNVNEPKTKLLVSLLKDLQITGSALLITDVEAQEFMPCRP